MIDMVELLFWSEHRHGSFCACVFLPAGFVQVVVWDTRAKSLPVQRTPLSTTGHTYPVYNLHIGGGTGTPRSNNQKYRCTRVYELVLLPNLSSSMPLSLYFCDGRKVNDNHSPP